MQEKLDKIKKHLGVKIVDEWSIDCDFYIYEESTADGYSIYVAAQNPDNITIEENVYYYDNDLGEALLDAIRHYECKNIYIDDPTAYWVEETVTELIEAKEEENK